MSEAEPAVSAARPDDRWQLDGRVALVTGASAGLGARFARVLHAAGPAGIHRCSQRTGRSRNSFGTCTAAPAAWSTDERAAAADEPSQRRCREEFLLVEPGTGRPQALAGTILRAARPELEAELQEQQLETSSRPCQSLDDLHRELRRCRASAAEEAERAGAHVVALATSPVPVEPSPVRNDRYERMAEDFGLTAQEQLTCGCHLHVGSPPPRRAWPCCWRPCVINRAVDVTAS